MLGYWDFGHWPWDWAWQSLGGVPRASKPAFVNFADLSDPPSTSAIPPLGCIITLY